MQCVMSIQVPRALHSIPAKACTGTKPFVFKPLRRKSDGPTEMQLLLKALDFIFKRTKVTIYYGMDYG